MFVFLSLFSDAPQNYEDNVGQGSSSFASEICLISSINTNTTSIYSISSNSSSSNVLWIKDFICKEDGELDILEITIIIVVGL